MNMREKIAEAIRHELDSDNSLESFSGIADRVIAAMREPTDYMIEVGFDISLDGKEWGKQTDILGIWRAMIDAAKEQR